MAQMTMIQAITNAMATELKNDENVLLFGEDIGVNGGVFRATEGLQEEFGVDRVFDTPLAESGIVSLGLGLTLENYRPIVEIQFFGFVFKLWTELPVKSLVTECVLVPANRLQLLSVRHSAAALIHLNFTQTHQKG